MQYLDRVIAATSKPGPWGEMLAAGAGAWFSASLALPSLAPAESPALAALTSNLGRPLCAVWFACVAVLSVVSMASKSQVARIIASHAAMFTWLLMVLVVCWRSGMLAPAVGAYSMFVVACYVSTRTPNDAG